MILWNWWLIFLPSTCPEPSLCIKLLTSHLQLFLHRQHIEGGVWWGSVGHYMSRGMQQQELDVTSSNMNASSSIQWRVRASITYHSDDTCRSWDGDLKMWWHAWPRGWWILVLVVWYVRRVSQFMHFTWWEVTLPLEDHHFTPVYTQKLAET